MSHSLRSQLLAWVLLPLVGAVGVDTWLTHRSAVATATIVQDRLLLGSARMIAEQISFEEGSFQHQIPPAALELFQSDDPDRIFYRITTGNGQLLAGYSDLPVPALKSATDWPHFFASTMRQQPVRVVAYLQPVAGNPSLMPVMVEVAQTTNAHRQLTDKLWLQALAQQLCILALATVLILYGLHRGLRPLIRLRDDVRARGEGPLQPLQTSQLPLELKPLVDALNDYAHRLERHTQRRSSFIQNAAHQLRTPLAVLGTQISYAQRAEDIQERGESLAAARSTLQQTVRVVNQFLALSSAEAREPRPARMLFQAVCSVVQKVLEDLALQAHSRDIDLGLDIQTTGIAVQAEPMALREILVNLVDNAIRYTPAGGVVTVRLDSAVEGLALVVEDNGPGIPASHHEQVFERFFRMQSAESSGSGLGLSIVRELALQCGATVGLATAQAGGAGLAVRIVFQTAPG